MRREGRYRCHGLLKNFSDNKEWRKSYWESWENPLSFLLDVFYEWLMYRPKNILHKTFIHRWAFRRKFVGDIYLPLHKKHFPNILNWMSQKTKPKGFISRSISFSFGGTEVVYKDGVPQIQMPPEEELKKAFKHLNNTFNVIVPVEQLN